MDIYKYEVINPVTDNKRPFFDNKRGLFIFPIKHNYRYYVECATTNVITKGREYFILLSDVKFNKNCRKCYVDNYGRCQIKLKGEIKEYVQNECNFRGNVEVEYCETDENYDVFSVI